MTSTSTYSDIHMELGQNGNPPILYDIQAVVNAMLNIINTVPGESDIGFNPLLGSLCTSQLQKPIDDITAYELAFMLRAALKSHEPRVIIDVKNTKIVADEQLEGFNCDIAYRVKGLSDQLNIYTVFLRNPRFEGV